LNSDFCKLGKTGSAGWCLVCDLVCQVDYYQCFCSWIRSYSDYSSQDTLVESTWNCPIPVAALAYLFPNNPLIAFSAGAIGLSLLTLNDTDESGEWFSSTWGFIKQITPLLLFGVLAAGFFLGRVGHEGAIPSSWISALVGGNSLQANFFASVVGAFMYLATLTEVPILLSV
jgi:hypothetical protein